MVKERQPNTGTFSKNQIKKKPSHADAGGSALICCPGCGVISDWYMNGWIKPGQYGRFTSIQFKLKDKQPGDTAGTPEKKEEGKKPSAKNQEKNDSLL